MPAMSSVKMESATVTTSATTSMPMSTSTSTTPPPPPSPAQIPAHTAPAIASMSTATTLATFQLPVNMSTNSMGNSAAATATATTTTTTITRNNISVTNIKCEVDDMVSTTTTTTPAAMNGGSGSGDSGVSNIHVPVIATNATATATTTTTIGSYFNGGIGEAGVGIGVVGVGIRIPVTKTEEDSDSETELTNIENLKVTRRVNAHATTNTIGIGGGDGGANGVIIGGSGCGGVLDLHHSSNGGSANNCSSSSNKNGPRPMSWEGELSETETTETELMETENSLSNGGGGGLSTITATPPTLMAATPASVITPMALGVAALIKSEVHAHATATAATTTTTTILAHSQQQQQQQQQQQMQHPFHATPRGSALHVAHAIKSEVEMDVHGIYVSPHGNNNNNNNNHHHQQHHQHHSHNNNNNSNNKLKLAPTQSDPINLKYEPCPSGDAASTAMATAQTTTAHNSPLLTRNGNGKCGGGGGTVTTIAAAALPLPANPSPDSAIHSVYTHSSPSQSPLTSRHAPYTPSLSRNNSDASHSSCYSYSSEFSPTHSPIQGRHATPSAAAAAAAAALYNSLHHSVLYRPISLDSGVGGGGGGGGGAGVGPGGGSLLPTPSSSSSSMEAAQNLSTNSSSASSSSNANANSNQASSSPAAGGIGVGGSDGLPASAAGISRQQLINSPCPICGDKISGFHYGIFSCESCKGFFKRTVQNRKNYVCVRGGPCPVSIATRKKCPACRFEKCLQKGMKLEAIREDRTRGGRSTYQCSYTLPPNAMLSPLLSPDHQPMSVGSGAGAATALTQQQTPSPHGGGGGGSGVLQHGSALNGYAMASTSNALKCEQNDDSMLGRGNNSVYNGVTAAANTTNASSMGVPAVPTLLQEIMNVEHLWQYNEAELARLNQPLAGGSGSGGSSATSSTTQQQQQQQQSQQQMTNPLLASAGLGENTNPDLIAHLCNVADHRLYKIVKWCKSLPLFKNISIDDQICLLINSWCELLLFSCCFRSVDTPGEIKMSQGKKLSLTQAKSSGLQACIERMLNLTGHLRRLRVDSYEYVAMKVIVLLQSDTSELREPVKVRECQEKALQSLQAYTLAHYPNMPSKFGELLLRIPELQRTCQLGKEMLTIKSRDGGDFNLLMELLRGEH